MLPCLASRATVPPQDPVTRQSIGDALRRPLRCAGQSTEKIRGPLGMTDGAEHRAFVATQDRQPGLDPGGVVFPNFQGNAEFCAEKRGLAKWPDMPLSGHP